jgi:hypothetical protein
VTPQSVVAVAYFPAELPPGLTGGPFRKPVELLRRASRYKRNPRDASYMRQLLEETYGRGVGVVEAPSIDRATLYQANHVVLLWPDGNGFGWAGVERRVRDAIDPSCKVFVLNGRRRHFELTAATHASYLARRLLERFWVGEIAFTLVFVVLSPFFVASDFLRGHR